MSGASVRSVLRSLSRHSAWSRNPHVRGGVAPRPRRAFASPAGDVHAPAYDVRASLMLASALLGGALVLHSSRPSPVLCDGFTGRRAAAEDAMPASKAVIARLIKRIDEERDSPETVPRRDAYTSAMAALASYPDEVSLQWRCARAAYDLSQEPSTPKAEAKQLLTQASQLIAKAKAAEMRDGDVYRWSGIVLSAFGDYSSTTDQIKNSFVIRSEFEQALRMNPSDASAEHLLGRWHFTVASMSWVKRKLASTLFAEPPSSTLDEAKERFLRAERISPGWWKANQVMLARVAVAQGQKEEALRWLRSALAIPVRSTDDAKEHADALTLLASVDKAARADWDAYVKEKDAKSAELAKSSLKKL